VGLVFWGHSPQEKDWRIPYAAVIEIMLLATGTEPGSSKEKPRRRLSH
jgi:hypothetical protein